MAYLVQGGAPPDDSVTTVMIKDNAVDETKLKDTLVADFTEVTVAVGDSILLGDVNDSGNTKRDTVQGILDLVPTASTSATGASELATTAETVTGTDTARVITPAGLHGALAGLTDATITASDTIIFADVGSSNALKEDTVQGILDLAGGGTTLSTAQATTSGTAKTFSDVPAGANRVTIIYHQVSMDGTEEFLVQIGDSGGMETTGYTSNSGGITAASQMQDAPQTGGFHLTGELAANVYEGTMILTRETGNVWVSTAWLKMDDRDFVFHAGTKTLSGEMTQLVVTSDGTPDDFDAGSVNVLYG
jgi:hypothetical protein